MQNLQGGWLIGVENIDIPTGEINICEQMRNLKSKHHYFKWTLYLFSQGKSAAVTLQTNFRSAATIKTLITIM